MPASVTVHSKKKEEQDALVLRNIGLAKSIALEIYSMMPRNTVSLDDLMQDGMVGLITAARHFNPTVSLHFKAYAKRCIQGHIKDKLRDHDYLSRQARKFRIEFENATLELTEKFRKYPSLEEVKKFLKISDRTWESSSFALTTSLISLSNPIHEDQPAARADQVISHEPDPEIVLQQAEFHELLWNAILLLRPRYQLVLIYYYVEDLSMKDIATRLDIVESRVSQLHKAALIELRSLFTDIGKNAF